jgi:hypothetical protein
VGWLRGIGDAVDESHLKHRFFIIFAFHAIDFFVQENLSFLY